MHTSNNKLSLFSFLMLTGSMIMTVYSYPAFASSGLSLVFFLIFAAVCYFFPVAFVAAEFATTKGLEEGGVYNWCSHALGKRWGFAAIFFQWLQISIGFVTMLYFIIGALAYATDIHIINQSPCYKTISCLVIFWTVTFLSFYGTYFVSHLAKIGFIFGISIPALLLITLAMKFILDGNKILIELSWGALIPDFTNVHTLVILVAFILSYAGIEASAVHINKLENPSKNYPLGIIIIALVAITLNILGAVSISMVIPMKDIGMNTGVVQAFSYLFTYYGLSFLTPIIALLLAVGTIAEICAWASGPISGILVAAKENILPSYFTYENSKSVPTRLVIAQGIVVSFWIILLTMVAGGSNLSFLLAMSLTVATYLSMYILLFFSYIKQKHFSSKGLESSYKMPGGKIGQWLIPIVGILMVIFSLCVAFFPPEQIKEANDGIYEIVFIISFIIILYLPHILYMLRKNN